MRRKDGPAIRDTLLWFTLLGLTGWLGWHFWGTWWCLPAFIVYGVLYCSCSDSRWHECGHRTAFKTTWMNDVIYELASFMVLREPTPWRWSHTRHHTDTIIVGRDPEISVPRPPDVLGILLSFFSVKSGPKEYRKIIPALLRKTHRRGGNVYSRVGAHQGLLDRAHLGAHLCGRDCWCNCHA